MKILVFGATGFVGSYLFKECIAEQDNVFGTNYLPTVELRHFSKREQTRILRCDIRYREQVFSVLERSKPDLIYFLSAQSFPALSWTVPAETLETNVIGTCNVYEGLKMLKIRPKIIVACSSAQYGEVQDDDIPVKESHPMRPLHPYGVSKVATELLAFQYWINEGIPSICTRIFNTTGPKKIGDVCADLTFRAVQIEREIIPPVLHVGNLETYRAITDVRDLVTALRFLASKGQPGEVYNISGAKLYQISDLVEIVKQNAKRNFTVKIDTKLLRTSDEKVIFGDSTKLYDRTGWKQRISIEKTITDMLDFWRINM